MRCVSLAQKVRCIHDDDNVLTGNIVVVNEVIRILSLNVDKKYEDAFSHVPCNDIAD